MTAANPLAELLGRLLHRPGAEPRAIAVRIRHRGAPGDARTLAGDDIARVGRQGLVLADGTEVPLHRVLEVRERGERVWAREERSG